MSRIRTVFAAAALALGATSAAEAATYTVRDNPNNGGSVFATGLSRNIDIVYNGQNRRVGAGAFDLQYGSDADGYTDFLTFCLQLHETLSLPKEHERVADFVYFDEPDRTAVSILYNNFMTSALGLANATSAAATQAIVWEIAEDGADNFNLGAGDFQLLTNSVLTTANLFWDTIVTGQFQTSSVNVFAAAGTQDLIVTETPIPAALPLILSGIAGLRLSARRRKTA